MDRLSRIKGPKLSLEDSWIATCRPQLPLSSWHSIELPTWERRSWMATSVPIWIATWKLGSHTGESRIVEDALWKSHCGSRNVRVKRWVVPWESYRESHTVELEPWKSLREESFRKYLTVRVTPRESHRGNRDRARPRRERDRTIFNAINHFDAYLFGYRHHYDATGFLRQNSCDRAPAGCETSVNTIASKQFHRRVLLIIES